MQNSLKQWVTSSDFLWVPMDCTPPELFDQVTQLCVILNLCRGKPVLVTLQKDTKP